MDEYQQKAIDMAMRGHNILLTGCAGSGKSRALHGIINKLTKGGISFSVTATTGIAALPFGGMTVHRFFGITHVSDFETNIIDRALSNPTVLSNLQSCSTLIIEEVSLLSFRMFELINKIACKARNDARPFGGIQLIACGDFFQLPPVPNYPFDEGQICFLSLLWKQTLPFRHCIILKSNFRQADGRYLKLLNEVRHGKLSDETCALLRELDRPLPSNLSLPILHSRIMDVKLSNYKHFQDISSGKKIVSYNSIDTGKHTVKLDQLIVAPKILKLTIGCPVILLKNISDTLKNGSRGIVTDFLDGFPLVKFENCVYKVEEKKLWSIYIHKELHTRTQLPLQLAFAMSIHKSQGLTLKSGVVDMEGVFAEGQHYTGLSRFTDHKSLQVRNFKGYVMPPNPLVKAYYEEIECEVVHEADLIGSNLCCRGEARGFFETIDTSLSNSSSATIFHETSEPLQGTDVFDPPLVEMPTLNMSKFLNEALDLLMINDNCQKSEMYQLLIESFK